MWVLCKNAVVTWRVFSGQLVNTVPVCSPAGMPKKQKDPCQKQACAIQMCLQGTCQQQLWCLYMLLKQVSPYRSANLVPFLQLTNTWRACVRTWSGTCGGAARRQRGTPSAAPGSRTQNPGRKTKVAHSSVWDRLMGVMVETPCFIECNTIELFVHIFW